MAPQSWWSSITGSEPTPSSPIAKIKIPTFQLPAIPKSLRTSFKLPKLPKSLKLPELTDQQKKIALGAVGATALLLTYKVLTARPRPYIIPSPRKHVHSLSDEERDVLPYPPDALPGGRDVETPYGTIRVYEWGPKEGERVMFVHGISTPCVALGDLAWEFVRRGYRVILFDLFSRGYSSGPSPSADIYDDRLYTTQLLLVHASCLATLPSHGNTKVHVVGYSLGGTLSVSFTRYFPHLVNSLTLIAPSGLLHKPFRYKLLCSGIMPAWLTWGLTRWFLSPSFPRPASDMPAAENESMVANPDGEEPEPDRSGNPFDMAPISRSRPDVSVASVLSWQLKNHRGFVSSFISTLKYAPIFTPVGPNWFVLRDILHFAARHKSSSSSGSYPTLRRGKVLMVLGQNDPVIPVEETSDAATEVLGDYCTIAVMDGGHELPIVQPTEVADKVFRFWAGKSVGSKPRQSSSSHSSSRTAASTSKPLPPAPASARPAPPSAAVAGPSSSHPARKLSETDYDKLAELVGLSASRFKRRYERGEFEINEDGIPVPKGRKDKKKKSSGKRRDEDDEDTESLLSVKSR